MCFNKNVSIITFSVMIASSIILILRNFPNDRWFSILFIFAGLMQFAEYLMWVDQKCGKINHYATLIAYLILLLQPLSILIGGYLFGELTFNKKKLIPIIIIYAIIFGLLFIKGIYSSTRVKLCTKPDGRHLSWNINKLYPSYILTVIAYLLYYVAIILIFFSKNKRSGIFLAILYIGTLLFSIFFVKNPSWKSFWCWIVNMIPVIYLIITSIFKKYFFKDTYYE